MAPAIGSRMDDNTNSWQVASMKCAALQLNLIVGDFEGNAAKILDGVRRASQGGAEL